MPFVIRVKQFFDESSIHGLKYITEKNRHWTERLFWIMMCSLATFALFNSSKTTITQVSQNPVSFVQETTYLRWNTEFPSLSICETDADLGSIEITAEKLFGADRNQEIDAYLREIAFFDGKCFTCKEVCGDSLECPTNFTDLAMKARVTCKELMTNCIWGGNEFECCDNFLPLQTEIGLCYTINSLQTTGQSKIQMFSNTSTGPADLSFSLHREAFVFLHPKEDVPFLNIPEEFQELVMLSSELVILYEITEIENGLDVREVPVSSRKCRFPFEQSLSHHRMYSYAACVTECRLNAQEKLCNCTHHFMRTSGLVPVCRLEQFECLLNNSDDFKKLKPLYSFEKGLACQCESSCSEPDLVVVSKYSRAHDDSYQSRVTVKLQNHPSKRFKRYLSRTRLDSFVTLGGLFGLYLGASILSLVEIFYIFCIRKTHRISSQNLWSEKRPPIQFLQ